MVCFILAASTSTVIADVTNTILFNSGLIMCPAKADGRLLVLCLECLWSWIITLLSANACIHTHTQHNTNTQHKTRHTNTLWGENHPPALSFERLFIHMITTPSSSLLNPQKQKIINFQDHNHANIILSPLPVLISYSSYLNSQPLSHRGLINHIQMWHLPLANVPGLPQALGQKSCLNCWNGTGWAEGRVGVPLVAWPDIHRSPMSHIAQSRRARVRAHTHSHSHTRTHARKHAHTHTHTH